MWYRVFCRSNVEVPPAEVLARVQQPGRPVAGDFRGDDLGWTAAELKLGTGTPVYVERYSTADDGLREDLNTWAGYLETLDYSPNHLRLMEHVIQTQQLVTARKPLDHPNESAVECVCLAVCQTIAAAADGVYQVESEGWYAADGTLLLQEY
jgi:hypothetical protein